MEVQEENSKAINDPASRMNISLFILVF